MASPSTRPHLPDLVIHKILLFLPTKSAVRLSFLSKKWEGLWCSAPIMDFDEGGEDGNNNLSQHRRFVENILSRYLRFIAEEEKEKHGLEKFKLHMTRYLSGDASIVTKLLSSSFERGVKELDISLRVSETQWDHGGNDIVNYKNLSPMELMEVKSAAAVKSYYYFSREALANANSLTTLNLGYVRIKNISSDKECSTSTCLLPSLKSMSLKMVHFDNKALTYLMHECPSIEYLSIDSCRSFGELQLSSSSLKSLQVEHWDCFSIVVDKAVNLESIGIISDIGPPQLQNFHSIIFKDCFKLKRMNICAPQLKVLKLDGCIDVIGTIDAPLLASFTFKGYLSSKFSVKAPNLAMSRIVLFDHWGREEAATFKSRPWNHFTTLSNFLKEFGSSKALDLYVSHLKALMFPKDFRETLSSPIFPHLEKLYFSVKNPPSRMGNKELSDSLYWMAPDVQVIENLPWRIRQGPIF